MLRVTSLASGLRILVSDHHLHPSVHPAISVSLATFLEKVGTHHHDYALDTVGQSCIATLFPVSGTLRLFA